jgi:SAM-dependent methyltransferase
MVDPGYFRTRFVPKDERSRIWRVLAGEFQRRIDAQGAVIDLGAGYCNLINNLTARERHALDIWPDFVKHAASDVVTHICSVTDMRAIADGSFDAAVASNLLEHLEWNEVEKANGEVWRVLKPGGRFVVLQPNYRYCSAEYFDDYTHRTPFSHVSLRDFLEARGWRVSELIPRFVPLIMKGWMPLHPLLTRLYLKSPIRPLARQMLVVVEKAADSCCRL